MGFLSVLMIVAINLLLLWVVVCIFQWMWNITLPDVFSIKKITFWQAFRILVIATFLFGSGSLLETSFSGNIFGEKIASAASIL